MSFPWIGGFRQLLPYFDRNLAEAFFAFPFLSRFFRLSHFSAFPFFPPFPLFRGFLKNKSLCGGESTKYSCKMTRLSYFLSFSSNERDNFLFFAKVSSCSFISISSLSLSSRFDIFSSLACFFFFM